MNWSHYSSLIFSYQSLPNGSISHSFMAATYSSWFGFMKSVSQEFSLTFPDKPHFVFCVVIFIFKLNIVIQPGFMGYLLVGSYVCVWLTIPIPFYSPRGESNESGCEMAIIFHSLLKKYLVIGSHIIKNGYLQVSSELFSSLFLFYCNGSHKWWYLIRHRLRAAMT